MSRRQRIRVRSDADVDALYIQLDESKIIESDEVKPGIIGVEVLDLKRRIPRADLKRLKVLVA